MRARDVVGRRIVRICQRRFLNRNTGRVEVELVWMKLEDGTVMSFTACESHVAPFVTCTALQAEEVPPC